MLGFVCIGVQMNFLGIFSGRAKFPLIVKKKKKSNLEIFVKILPQLASIVITMVFTGISFIFFPLLFLF